MVSPKSMPRVDRPHSAWPGVMMGLRCARLQTLGGRVPAPSCSGGCGASSRPPRLPACPVSGLVKAVAQFSAD